MPELRCGNCGYWGLKELRGVAVGVCRKIGGLYYLKEPTCRDACPDWGPEGGRGPGSMVILPGPDSPDGVAEKARC